MFFYIFTDAPTVAGQIRAIICRENVAFITQMAPHFPSPATFPLILPISILYSLRLPPTLYASIFHFLRMQQSLGH